MTADESYAERRLTVSRTARVGSVGAVSAAITDLWIVLHGYGQLASTFAQSAVWPLVPHRAFLFPEALQRFYDVAPGAPHADARIGASWMTREAREDDIADNHAYLDAVLTDARAVAPSAVVTVLGFSQGAATASRWAESLVRREQVPARLILWGGALPPDIDLGPDAPLRAVHVEIVIGRTDRWVTLQRSATERARLEQARFPVTLREFHGGHRLDNDTLLALAG